ncbi:MAG: hypothetical protein AB1512_16985 [Thermodesulfobacteriota bacterium]
MNRSCRLARYLNILAGIFLLGAGMVLVLTGFTIFPLIGFYLALPVMIGGLYFLFAPPDKACFAY